MKRNYLFLKMALFVLLGTFFIFNFSGSKDKKITRKNIPEGFENISWESEKLQKYQLIRPIEFSKGGVDVYGLPISTNQWYLITKRTDCYLLPVNTDSKKSEFMYKDFIDHTINLERTAIIDTMFANLMSNTKNFNGLSIGRVNKMEILCFKKGYSIEPTYGYAGTLTVHVKH